MVARILPRGPFAGVCDGSFHFDFVNNCRNVCANSGQISPRSYKDTVGELLHPFLLPHSYILHHMSQQKTVRSPLNPPFLLREGPSPFFRHPLLPPRLPAKTSYGKCFSRAVGSLPAWLSPHAWSVPYFRGQIPESFPTVSFERPASFDRSDLHKAGDPQHHVCPRLPGPARLARLELCFCGHLPGHLPG